MAAERPPLLSVRDLTSRFDTDDGEVQAVDGVSFDVYRGEVFAIVGESGSGKSVTAMSILGLLPTPAVARASDPLAGHESARAADEDELRDVRGNEIAMIFQDPLTALNPVHTDRQARSARWCGSIDGASTQAGSRRGRSRCSSSSASRSPSAVSTCTRTSSRAGCANGR